MTDKRKDEMPEEVWIQDLNIHDVALPYWYRKPTGTCTAYVRKDATPPVPDDVAEALDACKAAFEGYRYMSQDAEKYIETLRAASTPSPEAQAVSEVTVEEFIARFKDISGYKTGVVKTIKHWLMKEFPHGIKIIKIKAGGG